MHRYLLIVTSFQREAMAVMEYTCIKVGVAREEAVSQPLM